MPPPPPDMPPPPPPPGGPYGQPYGAPPAWTPAPSGIARAAAWWQRAVAVIVDLVLVMIVDRIVAGPSVEVIRSGDSVEWRTRPGSTIAFFVLWTLYAGLAHGLKGQTVGKLVAGIKVVRRDTGALLGVPLAVGRSALHALAWGFCGIPGIIDSLWPLWDAQKQSIHDKVVNSVVVKAR